MTNVRRDSETDTEKIDVEAIAAQIHEFYLEMAKGPDGWTPDYPQPYSQLPEHMKEDNRDAARRIGHVLSLAGLRLVPSEGVPWTKEAQDEILQLIKQNLDLLAEGEHDGWMESRLRHGWRLSDRKDVSARLSHLLVPYSKFPEQIERRLRAQQQPSGAAKKKATVDQATLQAIIRKEKDKDRDSVKNYVSIIAQTRYRIVREEA